MPVRHFVNVMRYVKKDDDRLFVTETSPAQKLDPSVPVRVSTSMLPFER